MILLNSLISCCLIFFVNGSGTNTSENFEEFYRFVNDSIERSFSYVKPKNNEELLRSESGIPADYGTWDFIIIGGGSAGALLAGRLSEIKKWNVLLLEAGDNQTRFSDVSALVAYSINSEMDWGYYSTPQVNACGGMVNNTCRYPRGKVLGGSAALNALTNIRGVPADFDDWAQLGNQGWSYEEVLPFFKSFEKVDFPNADQRYYGSDGNIHVNFTYPPSIVADTFIRANVEKGLPEIDYNGKGVQGVSMMQFHMKGNKRDNSAHAYLDPVQEEKNLRITTNAFVTKILVRNKQAYGVEFVLNKQKYRATAKMEVILSAGVINSPQILLLSGIGPEKELESLGIKPIVNLPAVGKHLKDQPMFPNFYLRTNLIAPHRTLRENLLRYEAGLTPLTKAGGLEQLAFLNDSLSYRKIELLTFSPPTSVLPTMIDLFNFNDEYSKVYSGYNTLTDMAIMTVLLKPKSEGSVTLKSKDPSDFPNIDLKYFSDSRNEDIETVYQGIQYALSLLETPAFKSINATFISTQPGCEHLRHLDDKEYWYCAIKRATTTVFHTTGTTRMGTNSSDSVVNSDLEVHEMKNLRVVDAGVMPDQIGGHPNSPTYMIAERTAHRIKLKYGVISV